MLPCRLSNAATRIAGGCHISLEHYAGIISVGTGVKTDMATFAIGVDLGGTNLRIAAVDQHGKVLEKITTGTEVARGRDQVINEMCTAIRDLSAKFRSSGNLAGIGIGV